MTATTERVDLSANRVADAEPEWFAQEDFMESPDAGHGWFPLAKRPWRLAIPATNSIARGRTQWD